MRARNKQQRSGAAAVEFAILLPLLAFLFVIGVDFARVFFHAITITNCARNGALYLSDPFQQATSPYLNYKQATKADAQNLDPALTDADISSTSGTGEDGHPYVEVTVNYSFHTVTNFPGVPSPFNLTRTVRMRITPSTPAVPNSGQDGEGETVSP